MAKLNLTKSDNPKLIQKKQKDGMIGLALEFYLGYEKVYDEKSDSLKPRKIRKIETLKFKLFENPKNPAEKEHNREILLMAKSIRAEREKAFLQDTEGYDFKKSKKINLLLWFDEYLNGYDRPSKRTLINSIDSFKRFLKAEYPLCSSMLTPQQLDKDMVLRFVQYLHREYTGEGPSTKYKRFKQVISYAVEKEILLRNPCDKITCKVDDSLKKEVLSEEEFVKLVNTSYPNQNISVRNAFILSLYTGIRFCDIKELKYSDIDYSNKTIRFNQNKTSGKSSASWVVIPLQDDILNMLGNPPKENKNMLLFNLPSHRACLDGLASWVSKAGIDKHITWHCARHTYATLNLRNGANIKTVSSLLGHSGLQHVNKYLRVIDEDKINAINNLPKLGQINGCKDY